MEAGPHFKKHVEDAFNLCLMGNYQERVIGMSKYWARDAHFYHVSFKTFNRDDAWGIYQLWSANNLGLGIVYDEIFCDKKHNSVLLDVTEICHVWWFFLKPFEQRVKIHTILDLRDTPHGKVIVHQYDHTLATETLVYNIVPWLGRICDKYIFPVHGAAIAGLGNAIYHHFQSKDPLPVLSGPALLDPEVSIPKAAEILFSCPPGERYAIVHRAFSPDATYYNSFLQVRGRDKIFGVFNFWANLNRSVEVKVVRVVPSGDRIMVDAVQTWTPRFWPTWLLHPPVWYQHVLMSTTDNPAGGKLITRAENHIITVDPFLKYQVGAPYEAMREFNGRLFGAAGRTIHHVLEWWHSQKVADKIAAHIPNGTIQEMVHKLQ